MQVTDDPTQTSHDRHRWLIWGGFTLALLLAPRVFSSNLSVNMLSQMGIAMVACLSYNMLLGQGGMLSFGHAVYTGLGAYTAMHALNAISNGSWALPVSLVPLVGGLGGMFFAALFGFVTTRKSGTTFAMITLGLAELVFAMSLMFSEFFGGEAGVAGNRVAGSSFWGITYGPAIEVYYLTAAYTLVCVALMYAFTRTPLGRMLNAVRDNPERVAFIGYNTQYVRYFSFIIAGFFAGVAGGLAALNFEIVTAEVVGAARSGAYLLFTFLGGATFFLGPIIGAMLMVMAQVLLSEYTKAWLLYMGLIFLFMVIYAPGGLASLLMMNWRLASLGRLRHLWVAYVGLGVTALVGLLGAAAMIEMVYHLQLNSAQGPELRFAGVWLDAQSQASWVGSVFVMLTGWGLFKLARRQFLHDWENTQAAIELERQRRETP